MTSFVAVLPALDHGLASMCVRSMGDELRDRLLVVDNSADAWVTRLIDGFGVRWVRTCYYNTGVANSWNAGIARAIAEDVDYLLIVSQSLRFGAAGGLDFLNELKSRQPSTLLHGQFGWHLAALHRSLWETIGKFDPVFSPGYREETDFLWRGVLAERIAPDYDDTDEMVYVIIDAESAGDAMCVKRGLVSIDFGKNTAAWIHKWGAEDSAGRFRYPYNDPGLPLTYIGAAP